MTTKNPSYNEFILLIQLLMRINTPINNTKSQSPNQQIIREDKKMKTRSNTRHASMITTLFCAAILSGASVLAQPESETTMNDEVVAAFMRIEMIMRSVEESVRYVAPSDVYDDIRLCCKRLELLASITEQEVKYRAPEVWPIPEPELTCQEILMGAVVTGLLTDYYTLWNIERTR